MRFRGSESRDARGRCAPTPFCAPTPMLDIGGAVAKHIRAHNSRVVSAYAGRMASQEYVDQQTDKNASRGTTLSAISGPRLRTHSGILCACMHGRHARAPTAGMHYCSQGSTPLTRMNGKRRTESHDAHVSLITRRRWVSLRPTTHSQRERTQQRAFLLSVNETLFRYAPSRQRSSRHNECAHNTTTRNSPHASTKPQILFSVTCHS